MLESRIPPRPPGSPSGSRFARRIRDLEGESRDAAALAELLRGNLPDFLRELEPVRLWGADRGGRIHEGVVFVAPDYAAVGSDEDSFTYRLGSMPPASSLDPSGSPCRRRRSSIGVHEQAVLRLTPQPMASGPRMRSTDYFFSTIWRSSASAEAPPRFRVGPRFERVVRLIQSSGAGALPLESGLTARCLLTKGHFLAAEGDVRIWGVGRSIERGRGSVRPEIAVPLAAIWPNYRARSWRHS